MKRTSILCLTTLLAAGVQAQTFNDTARVRNVEPRYENISVPRNECTSQWVTEQQPVAASRNYGGLAVGGVAGALLGNQVGKGRGRDAATALGAVVGALAAEHFANQNNWGVPPHGLPSRIRVPRPGLQHGDPREPRPHLADSRFIHSD
jgi:uncharacterized protein YcfJ